MQQLDFNEDTIDSQEIDLEILTRAELIAIDNSMRGDEAFIQKTYDLLKNHPHISRYLDQETLFEKNKLSKKNLRGAQNFSLRHLQSDSDSWGYEIEWGDKQIDGGRYEIFLDSILALSIFYEGSPLALFSFQPYDNTTVHINQIQQIRPYKIENQKVIGFLRGTRELLRLDWKSVLLEGIVRFSSSQGFQTISIKSAKNRNWTHQLEYDAAKAVYDDFAIQKGFSKSNDNNFYADINFLIRN